MKFIADLHIHSRYSIATSKSLDFENLHIAAQLKGITVVGTGDMTHPKWFAEAQEKLVPAEEGLYKLKDDISRSCDEQVPPSCRGPVRFMLTTEISNIYKKEGKTRKNHNLAFLPDLETAAAFNQKLDRIGNIKSDGRPILGLDARNLLEILLETSDQAFLVPAHIWTPWFSVLGSKSGFDSISECFEDLTHHIFAVETGLSSDPEMNWRVSSLDGLTLISNSDAHSPMKLGREANLFDTELSYPAIRSAMETGDPDQFLGTFEFYPEEGKYHMDGHRKCQVCFNPFETIAAGGSCPVCGKPLTLGVLYRVEELSDRAPGEKPEKTHPFYSIVPLTDILSEILNVGPNSKKVKTAYKKALKRLGSEFAILHQLSEERIERAGIPLFAEAVKRMRQKKIHVFPGYDGEFGKIAIFSHREKERLMGQKSLFSCSKFESENIVSPPQKKGKDRKRAVAGGIDHGGKKKRLPPVDHQKPKIPDNKQIDPNDISLGLNRQQLQAVEHPGGPLMIVAGPGTGKTLTLTHRIAQLLKNQKASSENILAVTFTNKAAREMRKRLEYLLGVKKDLPYIATFHSLCFHILQREAGDALTVIDERHRKSIISDAVKWVKDSGRPFSLKPREFSEWIAQTKLRMMSPEKYAEKLDDLLDQKVFIDVYNTYQRLLKIQGLCDYEDLISKVVRRLETDEGFRNDYRSRFRFIFVDEYQDLNQGQYRMIKALAPPGSDICVIGDPDQSIYGFRGSDVKYFTRFIKDYPDAKIVHLTRNYRSNETILKASDHVIADHSLSGSQWRVYSNIEGVKTIGIIQTSSDRSEAVAVGKIIERMVGGSGFHMMDFGKMDGYDTNNLRNFSDFAVLFRTGEQIKIFSECFEKAGIPCQVATRESIYEQKEIAGIISLLKVIEGLGSFHDLEKTVGLIPSGITKQTVERFKKWSYERSFHLGDALQNVRRFPVPRMVRSAQQKFSSFAEKVHDIQTAASGLALKQKIKYLVEQFKIQEKIEDNRKTREAFDRLLILSEGFDKDSPGFFTAIALDTDTDVYESRAEKVTLMTMHAAKGLEFSVVFIAGCEKNYIPFIRTNQEKADIDEERRLFFVAMTRARERLYFTYTKKRRIHGKMMDREISPFVAAIKKELLKKEIIGSKKPKKEMQVQLKLF